MQAAISEISKKPQTAQLTYSHWACQSTSMIWGNVAVTGRRSEWTSVHPGSSADTRSSLGGPHSGHCRVHLLREKTRLCVLTLRRVDVHSGQNNCPGASCTLQSTTEVLWCLGDAFLLATWLGYVHNGKRQGRGAEFLILIPTVTSWVILSNVIFRPWFLLQLTANTKSKSMEK